MDYRHTMAKVLDFCGPNFKSQSQIGIHWAYIVRVQKQ